MRERKRNGEINGRFMGGAPDVENKRETMTVGLFFICIPTNRLDTVEQVLSSPLTTLDERQSVAYATFQLISFVCMEKGLI